MTILLRTLAVFVACCLGTAALAHKVRITFTGAPPYMFAETGTGISIDIMREALASQGYEMEVVFVPTKRLVLEMELGNVEGTASVSGLEFDADKVFIGDSIFEFEDYIFTRADRDMTIDDPADLKGLTVVSFPTAKNIYPEWLGPAVEGGGYIEVADQISQVKMLYRDRADAVLADANIFAYLTSKHLNDTGEERIPVRRSALVGSVGSLPGFTSEALRDDFNAGLSALRASGRYDEIFKEYIE